MPVCSKLIRAQHWSIRPASNEQSLGVSQVGEAVTQMDQVTQQNAALVEEMAAAAGSLKSQAQDLVQTVAVFNLGAGNPIGRSVQPVSAMQRRPALAGKTPNTSQRVGTTRTPAPTRIQPSRSNSTASLAAPVPKPVPAATPAAGGDGDWETF